MTFEFRQVQGSCLPPVLAVVYESLALVDALIAVLAISQLVRIHLRNPQVGWTRQKAFHLLIGSSNTGYLAYFVLAVVAACNGWLCWSGSCGFVLMAIPEILFLAAFLLLLSYWVDLCHQPNDEDDEDEESSSHEALLEKTSNKASSSNAESHRRCCSIKLGHVGSRQKVVILVILLFLALTLAFALVIWIGMENFVIDSSLVAKAYVDLVAVALLLLGGALACYGVLLCSKMKKVRSERASSEMMKVAGLTVVSVLCFISSALVALLTNIPELYQLDREQKDGVFTAVMVIIYYLIGSSVPSAFILWIMRELPPSIAVNTQEESSTVTFISDTAAAVHHPQRWAIPISLQNQISRASPI